MTSLTPGRSALAEAMRRPEDAPLRLFEASTPSEVSVRRMWTHIQERDVSRPYVIRRNWSLAFAACVIICGLIVSWHFDGWSNGAARGPLEGAPLAFENQGELSAGQRLSASAEGRTLRFAEGSRIRMAPRSELSVLSNDGSNLVFSLRHGKANFSVTPGGPRRWTVDAGSVIVRVVGTVFSVDRDASGTRVSVSEGIVEVSGAIPGENVRLRAGQSIESRVLANSLDEQDDKRSAPADSDQVTEHVFSLDDLETLDDDAQGPKLPTSVPATTEADPDIVAGLLRDADDYRRQGRLGQAAAALRAAVRVAPPSDPRRALAALSYARLNLNPAEAAEVLSMTIDSMPPSLREPALSRLIRAFDQSGQEAAARAWRQKYLTEFPSGPQATQFRAQDD